MRNIISKKSQSISITLLVIMTMVICGVALASFLYADNKQTAQTLISEGINEFFYKESQFEKIVYDIAVDTLRVMLKHSTPVQISSEEFLNRFKLNYNIYSKLPDFPAEFKTSVILNQIQDDNNYNLKIENEVLKFDIKSLNFSQIYDSDKSAGLKSITLDKNLKFEIALKTLVPY